MPNDRDTTRDFAGRLSADEATELAGQVAALARSGLPLEPGLRALADELPQRRLASVLREMATRLEAGAALDEVIRSQGHRFPAHLRGLLLAGIRSGQLPEALEGFVDLHRAHCELRRRVWLSLAYPILLMSLLSLLAVLADLFIVDGFARVFGDFDVNLPDLTGVFLALSTPLAWTLAGGTILIVVAVLLLTTISSLGAGISELLHRIPLIGPLWRWGRLVQFARLMGMLLKQGTPLPEALRLTAAGVRDGHLANGCRQVATEVEAGRDLCDSMASHRQFPPVMIPLIDWGQRSSALPDAFEASAEMFEGNVQTQGVFMESALIPITFSIVVAFVSLFIFAMFLPLICLIEALS